MRIINKKYLLIIILVGVIITGIIIFKPKENIKLDNVISKQKVNNKTFAMYTETDNGYEEYKDNKFPEGYVLNTNESKCIDNNGKEVDNILSFNNGEVTITSGKTTYCYLYFDKSLGLEIKEKEPKGLSLDKERGAMYRFQGQARDAEGNELVDNYICFGTSDKDTCVKDTDHYMYRIIGIETSTGRVKVIKKEALNNTVNWWDDYDHDKTFPESKIYEAISGDKFLTNKDYIPLGWEEKISTNTWMYGDMLSNDVLGARQTGEGLYQTETGKKATKWYNYATKETPGAIQATVGYESSPYKGQTVYYTDGKGKWTKSFDSKVSLMYLHDYHYSVSDTANCQITAGQYAECKTGWMHLSNNDSGLTGEGVHEWSMSRYGWDTFYGFFHGLGISIYGYTSNGILMSYFSIRPVFYINASEKLLSGTGTITDPFMIKE